MKRGRESKIGLRGMMRNSTEERDRRQQEAIRNGTGEREGEGSEQQRHLAFG